MTLTIYTEIRQYLSPYFFRWLYTAPRRNKRKNNNHTLELKNKDREKYVTGGLGLNCGLI